MKKAPLLDIVLPFSDLWMMVKHHKKLFLKLILLFASLAFIVVLSRTPTYGAHGLLQVREEGGNKEFNFGNIFDMKRSAGSFVANPSPFLTSSNILYPVIDKLNLQAVIVENSKKRGLIRSLFTNFKENLILLYWSVQKKNTVALPDKKPPPFECTNILFDEEVPTSFLVNFNSLTQFSVSGNTGLLIGQGELGTPFNGSGFSFVLQQVGTLPLNVPFLVTLYPKNQVAAGLSNKLTIEVEKLNSHYFNISYTDRDRHLAANITNAVMDEYQTFLKNEVANSFEGQFEYLNKRQEQIQLQFDRTLESKKEKMKKWVGVSGYLSYTNGEKYLAESQEGLNNRKVHLDYEIKKIKEDGNFISKLMDYDDSHRLNVLLKKIENHRQWRTQLEHSNRELSEENYIKDLDAFEKIEEKTKKLRLLMEKVSVSLLPFSDSLLRELATVQVPKWLTYIEHHKKRGKELLLEYLQTHLQHFELQEKAYRERLKHPGLESPQLLGLDLNSAKELISKLNQEIIDTHIHTQQLQTYLNQIQDPNFEISSLSAVLQDSVSEILINKNTQLSRNIHNSTFYSTKEVTRMQEQLILERNYLKLHIQQKLNLSLSFEKALKNKLASLNKLTITLLNDKITHYQKQIDEYAFYKLQNLSLEKRLIEEEAQQNISSMQLLPEKWIFEKQIQFREHIGQNTLQTLTELIETTNLNNNLKKINSGPIERAVPEIFANKNYLWVLTILGALFGAFVAASVVFKRVMHQGVFISKENLTLASIQTCGPLPEGFNPERLTHLTPEHLSRIRKISHTLSDSQTLLFLQTPAHTYAHLVAELINKKGIPPLVVSLSFNEKTLIKKSLGLTGYLNGETIDLPIEKTSGFDLLPMGSYSSFLTELLSQEKMGSLLNELKQRYALIIFATDLHFTDSEVQALIPLVESIVVTCRINDHLNDLLTFTTQFEEKKLTCVLTQAKSSPLFTRKLFSKFRFSSFQEV